MNSPISQAKVNVSIVVYHTALDEIFDCLCSLDSKVVAQVWIVDNGSEVRISDFCHENVGRFGFRLIYLPSANVGYGAANNKAIASTFRSQMPYHLVLNSDVKFSPDILDAMIAEMDDDSSIGLLHPQLLNVDGSPQLTARRLPTPFDLILRRFLPQNWCAKRRALYLLSDFDLSRQRLNVPYVQGSFMLMRTDALRVCGMFDERFFMYPEDIDLTRRIHRKFKTVYNPRYSAIHNHRQGSYKSLKMLRIHIVNMLRYFNKWGWWCDAERKKFNSQICKV